MKDLSKTERLNQRIAELEQLIQKKDYEFDKEQWKRTKRTFFVICGVIYFLLIYFSLQSDINISNVDIKDIFYAIMGLTLGVGFVAGLIMFISYGVWLYIMNGAIKRVNTIAKLEGELNAAKSEKYNNSEDEQIKELKRHINYLENYYAHKCEDCTFLKLLKNAEENESNEVEEDEKD